jgi:5'/3'-nucleotidase
MLMKTMALGAGLLLASTSASALTIALTNDDGWSTPGIQSLYDALTEAGHTVVLAGPLDGQSGSGSGINISTVEVTKEGDNQYSVALEGGEAGAEPATSGAIAVDIAKQLTGQTPDLLVSGINDGANLAAATYTSGTVGAAIHALGLLVAGESIPAIAISTDDRCDEEEGLTPECREVADFLVDYIDHLEQRPNFVKGFSGLIPGGRGLNINFPPGEPMGVAVARQGRLPLLLGQQAGAEISCDGCSDLEVGETGSGGFTGLAPLAEGLEDVVDADQELYRQGFITVVVIEASYEARAVGLKRYLRQFEQ